MSLLAEDTPKWLHKRLADSILANAKAVTLDLNYMSCKIEQGAFAAASALGSKLISKAGRKWRSFLQRRL